MTKHAQIRSARSRDVLTGSPSGWTRRGLGPLLPAFLAASVGGGAALPAHEIPPPGQVWDDREISEQSGVRVTHGIPGTNIAQTVTSENFTCGTLHPDTFHEALLRGIARGEVPDPLADGGRGGTINPPNAAGGGPFGPLTRNDIFPYEDTFMRLVSNFSDSQLFTLMGRATDALTQARGDHWDFVAFWCNFVPHHQIGSAFYLGLYNDTFGLGLGPFDRRGSFGLDSERIQGWVMMWNVNSWNIGAGGSAAFTRLVLGQEFEHRWGMFLNSITGGRVLQGGNDNCGRSAHWNFRVDGQGSGMEIAEWVGSAPANRVGGSLNFNSDIGGVFSYTDLYLMGYVSAFEMDQGNSQLRYMDTSPNCGSGYNGNIFNFNSSAIIDTNGMRSPSSNASQKTYRTAWIMIHQPGSPPTNTQLDRAVGIMTQHQIDWFNGTLGRGTLDNSLVISPGGDTDEDGDVDVSDFGAFVACTQASPIGSECDVFDYDGSGVVDLRDFGTFQRAYTGNCGVRIAQQPQDTLACSGDAVMLSVQTQGTTPAYQWRRNGLPVAGATGSILTLNPVTPQNAGFYRVTVAGQCTTVLSEEATVSLNAAPTIVSHPTEQVSCVGGSATFTAQGAGVPPIGYQWRFESQNILGATGATLDLDNLDPSDVGSYHCVVTDDCGLSTPTQPASLSFAPPAGITLQPEGGEFCQASALTLFVIADGTPTFQWFKDDQPLAGATEFFYFIPELAPTDAGTYRVVATAPCDTAASDPAVVTVVDCGGEP